MDLSLILPDQFQLTQQQVGQTTICFGLVATQTNGQRPACQMTTNKVHSFYQRTLADLPISGRAVSLRIHLRKFVCRNDQCTRKIFAQTVPAYFPAYARRLNRAQHPMQGVVNTKPPFSPRKAFNNLYDNYLRKILCF